MRRLLVSHRTFVIVCLAVIVPTAAGAFLAVHEYERLLFDAFRERSIAYVQAFVASTRPWLDPLNEEMLHAASRLMLVGSALYVQLSLEGVLVVDERSTPFLSSTLEEIDPPAAASANLRHPPGGPAYLEVAVPIVATRRQTAGGYGRIGIDRTSVLLQARNTALLAGGITLLFDILVLGSVFCALRRHRPAAEPEENRTWESSQLVAGSLTVDLDTKSVTLGNVLVALTPKQFALLSFLAENADRVCSDREILDAVWADSPYADAKDVKQYVYLVRRRLAKVDPSERDRIQTVPGYGYKLVSTLIDQTMTKG